MIIAPEYHQTRGKFQKALSSRVACGPRARTDLKTYLNRPATGHALFTSAIWIPILVRGGLGRMNATRRWQMLQPQGFMDTIWTFLEAHRIAASCAMRILSFGSRRRLRYPTPRALVQEINLCYHHIVNSHKVWSMLGNTDLFTV